MADGPVGAPGAARSAGGRPPDAVMAAARRLERASGLRVRDYRRIGGEHGVLHYRGLLDDGSEIFVKSAADEAAEAPLAAEACGLRWLGEAGTAAVPAIVFAGKGQLAVRWLPPEVPGRAAAERFGRDLARLHVTGAARFGARWSGYIASLPLPNDEAGSWPEWYARCRILPYCRLARDAGTLRAADVAVIEAVAARIGEIAGPDEPPSRIHGDLWSGNVHWSGGRGWLIDPAAHGGHRETDLAMLALFGAPHLGRILDAYQEAAPLARGWQARVPLHQLHPLLVHVCLFGGGYRDSALAAARAALAARAA